MTGEVLRLSMPPFGPIDIGVVPREGGTVQFTATSPIGGRACRVSVEVARQFGEAILRAADAAEQSAAHTETGA